MVSVCLLSDALLQHLPSYLSFSYLGHWVSLHGCCMSFLMCCWILVAKILLWIFASMFIRDIGLQFSSFCLLSLSDFGIFARYSNFGCTFPPFSTLNISCHSFLAWRISAERSSVKHIGFPLYVTYCFSLVAFNILSLCLVFVSFISMCLGMFLLGFILYRTLCASWTWLTIFFSCWRNFQI